MAEGKRVTTKHLLTLEPGISENQTGEMIANNLQLVVPKRIHTTYKEAQRDWLFDVAGFLSLVRDRQPSE
ncbi:MAG: type II restriction endonuclease [Alphaproteobacteria bacterium]